MCESSRKLKNLNVTHFQKSLATPKIARADLGVSDTEYACYFWTLLLKAAEATVP